MKIKVSGTDDDEAVTINIAYSKSIVAKKKSA